MKRGTTEHPKLLALCSILNIEKCMAVGILELMWHFTAKYAPQGDIGRYSDAAIAKAVDWKRPTGARGVTPECKLSGALVMAKWLDSDPVHRLIVHDWKDHCDESVKKFLSRHGLDFVRPVDRLPLPLPLPLPEPVTPTDIVAKTAERMYALHPKKKNKPLVEHALQAIASNASDVSAKLEEIESCHRLWCATEEWNEKNGQFAPKLDEWLVDEGYTKRPRDPTDDDVFVPSGWTLEQVKRFNEQHKCK